MQTTAYTKAILLLCMVGWSLTGCRTTDSAIPERYHGVWSPHEVGAHSGGGEGPWVFTAETIDAHESRSDVQSVEVVGEGQIRVTQDVYAEGMRYREEKTFTLSPDGARMIVDDGEGDPFTLYRLP